MFSRWLNVTTGLLRHTSASGSNVTTGFLRHTSGLGSLRCLSTLHKFSAFTNIQTLHVPAATRTVPLLHVATPPVHAHGYKVKVALRKRCPHCYFERREGRMFVECKVKPRHKQMQKLSKKKLFREDHKPYVPLRMAHGYQVSRRQLWSNESIL